MCARSWIQSSGPSRPTAPQKQDFSYLILGWFCWKYLQLLLHTYNSFLYNSCHLKANNENIYYRDWHTGLDSDSVWTWAPSYPNSMILNAQNLSNTCGTVLAMGKMWWSLEDKPGAAALFLFFYRKAVIFITMATLHQQQQHEASSRAVPCDVGRGCGCALSGPTRCVMLGGVEDARWAAPLGV